MDNFTEIQGVDNPNKNNEPISIVLPEVSMRQEYKPRILRKDENPIIAVSSGGGVEVEEAELIDRNRAFFCGDSHGLIFPMLDRARKAGIISLPIHSILNADYHADIAIYNSGTYSYTASWERYGVDQRLWNRASAYNFRPSNSTAGPYPTIHAFSNEVTIEEAARITPQVLSVDLDFFKRMRYGTDEYLEHLEVLKAMAKNARVVMVFSSAGWNYDYEKSQPYQSKEQIGHIVTELMLAFSGN